MESKRKKKYEPSFKREAVRLAEENTVRPVDRQDAIFLKEKLSRQNRKSNASKPEKQTKQTRSTK